MKIIYRDPFKQVKLNLIYFVEVKKARNFIIK